MKPFFATLVVVILLPFGFAEAQTTHPACKITGTVVSGESGEGEEFVTVSIVNNSDASKAISKCITGKDGSFSVSIPAAKGSYMLIASYLGKKADPLTFSLEGGESEKKVGVIELFDDVKMLSGVNIVAQKPLVKMDVDKLSYDVTADPDARMSNISEILRKVPLVDVDADGNIKMNGTTKFLILQNGRRSSITRNPKEVLRSLPAHLVKNIEVITTPGAKYDAEGIGGIINIVMQSKYEGHLTAIGAQLNTLGYNAHAYSSTKMGKFALDGSLSYNRITNPTGEDNTLRENYASEQQKWLNSTNAQKPKDRTEFANINASYEIDTLRLLTLSLSGMAAQRYLPSWGTTEMLNADRSATAYSYTRNSTPKNSVVNGTFGLDYQRTSRRNRQRVHTLSYQLYTSPSHDKATTLYSNLVNNTPQDIIEEMRLYDNRTDSRNRSTEHTLQYDFTTPIGSRQTLEVGMKYILRNNESTNDVFDDKAMTSNYVLNASRSNHYKNRNDIFGTYLSYVFRGKVLSVMPGLRYEYTYQSIEYLAGAIPSEADYDSHYANLVPSLKLNFTLGKTESLRLEYGMRLSRPSIYYLNPYFNDANPQNISQGNSNLEAERSQSLTATFGQFTRKLNLNLSLSYTFLNDGIERVSHIVGSDGEYFDNRKHFASPGAMYSTFENIGHTQRTAFDYYLRWNILPKMSCTINGSVAYLDIEDPARRLRNNGWTAKAYLNLSGRLPADISFSARVGTNTRNITLQGNSSSFWSHSLSLSRGFLKEKRLTVSISTTDPFRKWVRRDLVTEGANFRNVNHQRYTRQIFGISMSYRFGNLGQSKTRKVTRGISNDDLKREEQ